MASEFADPPQNIPQHHDDDDMDTSFQQSSSAFEEPIVNGEHTSTTSDMQPSDLATGSSMAPPEEPFTHETTEAAISDPLPPAPLPVEHVESGIAPVADFLPKEAASVSQLTPPPDEPLITGSADVDVEMTNAEVDILPPSADPEPPLTIPVLPEQSLVRPREDDEIEEPAAKRSRLDETPLDLPISETEIVDEIVDAPVVNQITQSEVVPAVEPEVAPILEAVIEPSTPVLADPVVETVVETITEPIIEPAIEPAIETAIEPAAESIVEAALEDQAAESIVEAALADPAVDEIVVEEAAEPMVQAPIEEVRAEITPLETSVVENAAEDAPVESIFSGEPAAAVTESPITQTPVEATPLETPAVMDAPAQPDAPAAPSDAPKYDTGPMTAAQKSALVEKTKNLKKTKNSTAFLRPVDPIVLNIPSYLEIVKEPMDLTTMEQKLKEGKYQSVADYAHDFHLIIGNARRFNGDAHAVTQAGFAMEAYFNRMMESVPSPNQPVPVKAEKKRSPSLPREKPRRESRAAAQPAAAAPPTPVASAATSTDVYALQPDGTPQIRRQSSMSGRPAREIKPPQHREPTYAKPKRKEHQLELRFCESVLDELRSPKHATTNHVFMFPVDPVALNIPHYRQIVKTPMDLTTMSQKLRSGQYGTAVEFKKDFDLIVKNCLAFNPVGNPVRDLGIQFQREFEQLWANKEKWEKKNQPVLKRASSASGDEESGADDEEEEEDEGDDDKTATIRALQKQLAAMQNALSGLHGEKPAKPKKARASKDSGRKQSAPAVKKAAPKPAAKPKKPRTITYQEKEEISEAVNSGKMTEKQSNRLTEIITQNCEKYRDMDEMELEIDDLPNNVQIMLLDHVRSIFGNPNKKTAREPSPDDAAALDDDDYEEKGGARGGKRKKHRPMGKTEQQDSINALKSRLAQFNSQVQTSASESPTNSSFNAANAQAETSGDEESEESEEE